MVWALYDDLLTAIPPDLRVRDCLAGQHWTLVRSKTVGVAMTPQEGQLQVKGAGHLSGLKVRELAGYIKSWNFNEATLGLAALNSALNTPEQAQKLAHVPPPVQEQASAFAAFREQVRGRKVAVIGHFPDLELLADSCTLSILERRPREGDFPDPACEYILPEQDYVFITATTLVNKTLPRLLELARPSRVILVGPSTPLTGRLFHYGISVLAGTVVTEPERVWQFVQEGGGGPELFNHGCCMVKVEENVD
ncbi:hypothetical protein CEB3_c51090 [Peptococcaceae bacterium CEB3]|nr:hypothetical protein CEB3_c51090 [Peptococcaceae bacterium CEB3]